MRTHVSSPMAMRSGRDVLQRLSRTVEAVGCKQWLWCRSFLLNGAAFYPVVSSVRLRRRLAGQGRAGDLEVYVVKMLDELDHVAALAAAAAIP